MIDGILDPARGTIGAKRGECTATDEGVAETTDTTTITGEETITPGRPGIPIGTTDEIDTTMRKMRSGSTRRKSSSEVTAAIPFTAIIGTQIVDGTVTIPTDTIPKIEGDTTDIANRIGTNNVRSSSIFNSSDNRVPLTGEPTKKFPVSWTRPKVVRRVPSPIRRRKRC